MLSVILALSFFSLIPLTCIEVRTKNTKIKTAKSIMVIITCILTMLFNTLMYPISECRELKKQIANYPSYNLSAEQQNNMKKYQTLQEYTDKYKQWIIFGQ